MRKYGWGAAILALFALVLFLWLIKAPILSSYLSGKLGVPVSIGSISMWPSQTNMKNFRIKNPRGFKAHHAFQADQTLVQYRFHNLFGNPSEIDRIDMNNLYLSVEFSNPLGTKNNWTAIAAKMPKTERKQDVVIHKLVLTNITVEIRGLGLTGSPQIKQIPRIELNEINSAEGFPTKQLIQQVFKGAGIQQFIQDAFNPQKVLQKLGPFNPLGSENLEIEKASE